MRGQEHSSRNEHTRYCFLPGCLSLPPRSSRCPGCPVTRGAPSPWGASAAWEVFGVGGQLCESPSSCLSHGRCHLSVFGGCQKSR